MAKENTVKVNVELVAQLESMKSGIKEMEKMFQGIKFSPNKSASMTQLFTEAKQEIDKVLDLTQDGFINKKGINSSANLIESLSHKFNKIQKEIVAMSGLSKDQLSNLIPGNTLKVAEQLTKAAEEFNNEMSKQANAQAIQQETDKAKALNEQLKRANKYQENYTKLQEQLTTNEGKGKKSINKKEAAKLGLSAENDKIKAAESDYKRDNGKFYQTELAAINKSISALEQKKQLMEEIYKNVFGGKKYSANKKYEGQEVEYNGGSHTFQTAATINKELDEKKAERDAIYSKGADIDKAAAEMNKAITEKMDVSKIQQDIDNLNASIKTMSEQDASQAIQSIINKAMQLDGVKEKFKELQIDPKQITSLELFNQAVAKVAGSGASEAGQKLQQLAQKLNETSEAGKKASAGVGAMDTSLQKMDATSQDVQALAHRITYFFGLANAARIARKAINDAKKEIEILDKTMTETAVVTDFSIGDMWSQLPEYTKIANDFGATINDAYKVMTLFYQQGLQTNQVFAVGEQTMKMARIAGLDYEEATNRMTNALRGFNMEINASSSERVADVYSQLAAMSASNVKELSIAMTKTASLANSANMSFENTAAFLAQIVETTRESAETAGTALKTVIARFSEVKKLYSEGQLTGDVEGEAIDVNKVGTALRAAGVDLNQFMTGAKGLDEIFIELADKWDSLDLLTQRYIATMAAGSRQQSRFLALMSDNKRLTELVSGAYNSAGASTEQFEKTQESLEFKTNRLKNAYDEFLMGITDSATIKGAVDGLTALLNVFNELTTGISGIGTSFKRIVSVLSIFFAIKAVATQAIEGVAQIFVRAMSQAGTEGGIEAGQNFIQRFSQSIKANGFKNGIKGAFKDSISSIGQTFETAFKPFTSNQFNKVFEKQFSGISVDPKLKDSFFENTKIAIQESQTAINGYQASYEGLIKTIQSKDIDINFSEASIKNAKDYKLALIGINNSLEEKNKNLEEEYNKEGTSEERKKEISKLQTEIKAKQELVTSAAVKNNEAFEKNIDRTQEMIHANSQLQTGLMGISMAMGLINSLIQQSNDAGRSVKKNSKIATNAIGTVMTAFMALSMIAKMNPEGILFDFLIGKHFAIIIAAILGAIFTIIKVVSEAKKDLDITDELNEALESTKEKVSDLESAWDSLKDGKETLDSLTKGTQEWYNQLTKVNLEVLDLIKKYPEFEKFISKDENGMYVIDYEEYSKAVGEELEDQMKLTALTGINAAIEDYETKKEEADKSKDTRAEDYTNLKNIRTTAIDTYLQEYFAAAGQEFSSELTAIFAQNFDKLVDKDSIGVLDDERMKQFARLMNYTYKDKQFYNTDNEVVEVTDTTIRSVLSAQKALDDLADSAKKVNNVINTVGSKTGIKNGGKLLADIIKGDSTISLKDAQDLLERFDSGYFKNLDVNERQAFFEQVLGIDNYEEDKVDQYITQFQNLLEQRIYAIGNAQIHDSGELILTLLGLTDEGTTFDTITEFVAKLTPILLGQVNTLLNTVGNKANAEISKNVYEILTKLGEDEISGYVSIFNNISFDNAIEGYNQLKKYATDTNEQIRETAKLLMESDAFSTEKMLQQVGKSGDWEKIQKKLKNFIKTNNQISAKNIKELASEFEQLDDLLETDKISASQLADVFESMTKQDLTFNEFTKSVLDAISSVTTLEGMLDEIAADTEEFDLGHSTKEGIEAILKDMETVQEDIYYREYGNPQILKLLRSIYTTDVFDNENLDKAAYEAQIQKWYSKLKHDTDVNGIGFWNDVVNAGGFKGFNITGQNGLYNVNIDEGMTTEKAIKGLSETYGLTEAAAKKFLAALEQMNVDVARQLNKNNVAEAVKEFVNSLTDGVNKGVTSKKSVELLAESLGIGYDKLVKLIQKEAGDKKKDVYIAGDDNEKYGLDIFNKDGTLIKASDAIAEIIKKLGEDVDNAKGLTGDFEKDKFSSNLADLKGAVISRFVSEITDTNSNKGYIIDQEKMTDFFKSIGIDDEKKIEELINEYANETGLQIGQVLEVYHTDEETNEITKEKNVVTADNIEDLKTEVEEAQKYIEQTSEYSSDPNWAGLQGNVTNAINTSDLKPILLAIAKKEGALDGLEELMGMEQRKAESVGVKNQAVIGAVGREYAEETMQPGHTYMQRAYGALYGPSYYYKTNADVKYFKTKNGKGNQFDNLIEITPKDFKNYTEEDDTIRAYNVNGEAITDDLTAYYNKETGEYAIKTLIDNIPRYFKLTNAESEYFSDSLDSLAGVSAGTEKAIDDLGNAAEEASDKVKGISGSQSTETTETKNDSAKTPGQKEAAKQESARKAYAKRTKAAEDANDYGHGAERAEQYAKRDQRGKEEAEKREKELKGNPTVQKLIDNATEELQTQNNNLTETNAELKKQNDELKEQIEALEKNTDAVTDAADAVNDAVQAITGGDVTDSQLAAIEASSYENFNAVDKGFLGIGKILNKFFPQVVRNSGNYGTGTGTGYNYTNTSGNYTTSNTSTYTAPAVTSTGHRWNGTELTQQEIWDIANKVAAENSDIVNPEDLMGIAYAETVFGTNYTNPTNQPAIAEQYKLNGTAGDGIGLMGINPELYDKFRQSKGLTRDQFVDKLTNDPEFAMEATVWGLRLNKSYRDNKGYSTTHEELIKTHTQGWTGNLYNDKATKYWNDIQAYGYSWAGKPTSDSKSSTTTPPEATVSGIKHQHANAVFPTTVSGVRHEHANSIPVAAIEEQNTPVTDKNKTATISTDNDSITYRINSDGTVSTSNGLVLRKNNDGTYSARLFKETDWEPFDLSQSQLKPVVDQAYENKGKPSTTEKEKKKDKDITDNSTEGHTQLTIKNGEDEYRVESLSNGSYSWRKNKDGTLESISENDVPKEVKDKFKNYLNNQEKESTSDKKATYAFDTFKKAFTDAEKDNGPGYDFGEHSNHPGADLHSTSGNGGNIPSLSSGKVKSVIYDDKSYGNQVVIEDENGLLHHYSHLGNISVSPNETVEAGQIIAQQGWSGNVQPRNPSGSHLDYEIYDTNQNKWINPRTFVKSEGIQKNNLKADGTPFTPTQGRPWINQLGYQSSGSGSSGTGSPRYNSVYGGALRALSEIAGVESQINLLEKERADLAKAGASTYILQRINLLQQIALLKQKRDLEEIALNNAQGQLAVAEQQGLVARNAAGQYYATVQGKDNAEVNSLVNNYNSHLQAVQELDYEIEDLYDQRDELDAQKIDQVVGFANQVIEGVGQVAQSVLQMIEKVAQSMVDGFKSFLKWLTIRIEDEHDIGQLDESLKNRKELLDWEYEKLTQRDFNYLTGKNSKAQEFVFDNLDVAAKNILTRLQNQRQLYANSFRQLEDLGTNINSDIESSLENLYDALYGVEGVFTKFNNKVQYLEQRFSKTMNLNLSSLRNLQLDWGKYGEMMDEALDPLKFFDGTLVEKIFKKSFEKLAGLQITEYRAGDIGESLLQKIASIFNSLSPKFDADYQIVNKSELVDALTQKMGTIITNGTITEQFVSGYLEYLTEIESQMENEVSNIRNAETEILSLYDEMTEILEKGKEEYNELEQAIYDAIVSEKESIKEELEELNVNISNADSEWINILKNNLEQIRDSRENDKTEQDLRDKQARLAYLRQDTSDANQAEILKLEKELKENQQSYTDKLIDQKISELERQNEEAATQRQVQIDLLEAEIANTEGIWKKVHELLDAISGEGSWDEILNGEIKQSAYNNIIDQLKKTSDYNDKSAHLQEEAIQEWGNLIRNAAVYGTTQKGEFREQYNNLKLLKEIIDSDTKLPIDHSPNQGWYDYVAFSNLESAVSDNTEAIRNAVDVINRLVDNKTLSFEETGSVFKKATEVGGAIQALSGFEDALKNAANDIAGGLPGILTQVTTGLGNIAKGVLKGGGAVMDTMAGAVGANLAMGDLGEAGANLIEGMSNLMAAGFDGVSLMCDIIGDTSPGITDMGVAAGTIIANWINNAFEDVTETLMDNTESILDEVFGPALNGVRTHGGAYLMVDQWLNNTEQMLQGKIGDNTAGFMSQLRAIYTDIGNQFDSLDLDDIEGFNKQYARFLTLQKLLEKINNNEGSVGMETTASIEKLSHWSGEIGSIFEEISPKEKTRIANALNAALYEVVKDESLITGDSKLTIWDSTLKLKESDLNYYNDIYKEFVDEVEYSVDQIDAAIVALNNMFYDPLTDTYSSNSVELLIKKLQDLVPERAEQAVQIEKNIWTVFTEGIKDAWGEFGATIKSAFAGSVDGIKVILEEIKGLIAGIVGAGHARGGSIYRRLYSLTGEEGAELVQHDDGTATLVGMNGPEMADLRRGDKVYNAEQTKKILASKQSMNFKRFAEGTVGTLMDRELPLLMPTKAVAMGYGNGFNASQTNRQNTFNLNLNLEGLTVDSVDRVNEVASMVWDKLNTTITGAMWPYNRL